MLDYKLRDDFIFHTESYWDKFEIHDKGINEIEFLLTPTDILSKRLEADWGSILYSDVHDFIREKLSGEGFAYTLTEVTDGYTFLSLLMMDYNTSLMNNLD
ncbi:MAG: hypothetical protein M0R77_00710 [Gammaproteobacteria bacterium]|nr:hypothetical protein [Acholeplasmataceae bacterium]MCK9529075.1 hypothetical protein [Gammaproteobacteria bacterium]